MAHHLDFGCPLWAERCHTRHRKDGEVPTAGAQNAGEMGSPGDDGKGPLAGLQNSGGGCDDNDDISWGKIVATVCVR